MFHNPRRVRLGCKPARQDSRTLRLARYLAPDLLPAVPDFKNWATVYAGDWGMMANDRLGDCTAAAAGHMILLDTAARGAPVRPSDADIVAAYAAVSGYTPGNPSSDAGAVELDFLQHWQKQGVGGHKIIAYVSIPVGDIALIRAAIALFGAVYAGVNLPVAAQKQGIWRPTIGADSEPGSWGGHAVPIVGYDTAAFTCITWGQPQWFTQGWWLRYGSEAWAVITEDWAPQSGLSPSLFNRSQLLADVAAIQKES